LRRRNININLFLEEGNLRLDADSVPGHDDLVWPSLEPAQGAPEPPASARRCARARDSAPASRAAP
jgi:hypothetical protein